MNVSPLTGKSVDRPLFPGIDTHALSVPEAAPP
jgi:hypothetical protein